MQQIMGVFQKTDKLSVLLINTSMSNMPEIERILEINLTLRSKLSFTILNSWFYLCGISKCHLSYSGKNAFSLLRTVYDCFLTFLLIP